MHESGELDELWLAYVAERAPDLRDRLILHYAPLVKFVAGRVGSGLPPSVETADLVSYGLLGLINAIERFDPGRGVRFETYALTRVRGSIMDELRALDWVPRSVRTRARTIERATSALEARLKRAPTDEELAEEVGVEVADLREQLGEIAQLSMVMLDDLLASEQGATTVLDTIEDATAPAPGASMEEDETRAELGEALDGLGDRDRLVITLYYYEGFTLSQIGEVLGVTESRVSQIHSRAVLALRVRLQALRQG